jgi:hypothetical protein
MATCLGNLHSGPALPHSFLELGFPSSHLSGTITPQPLRDSNVINEEIQRLTNL